MTTRRQFFRVHLLTTGTTVEVTALDWREALAKTGRRDAAVLMRYPLPGHPEAVAAVHLPGASDAGPCFHPAEIPEKALAAARHGEEVTQ